MAVLANRIYLFYTLEEFKDYKKGDMSDLLKKSIFIAFLYMVSYNLYRLLIIPFTFYLMDLPRNII